MFLYLTEGIDDSKIVLEGIRFVDLWAYHCGRSSDGDERRIFNVVRIVSRLRNKLYGDTSYKVMTSCSLIPFLNKQLICIA